MPKRLLLLLLLLLAVALVVAACSPSVSDETTTTSTASVEEPTTTTTTEPSSALPDTALLSYALESGATFSYEMKLNQHLELSASGDPSLMGDDELPGEAVIDLEGTAVFTYTVSDGPEPGTYEINVVGAFEDLAVTGTADGEPVGEVPDFAGVEPVDVTVIVDEQGNPIVIDGGPEDPLGGLFGDFNDLGGAGSTGLDPGQFFGPPFPGDEVGVGDSWTDEIETALFGDEPVVTRVTSTITAADEVDGVDVFVIETSTSTSLIEVDLGEFFLGLLGAFIPEDATAEELSEFDAMMAQLQFLISIDDTEADTTTWFDPVAGVVHRSETDGTTAIAMSINIPDETTGELVGFEMDMAISQQISLRLVDGPAA
jgi:hypothetical protein